MKMKLFVFTLLLGVFYSGAGFAEHSGQDTFTCNEFAEVCVITVYAVPPEKSLDGTTASNNCTTYVDFRKVIVKGMTKRVVWVLAEAFAPDPAKYRFDAGEAIKLNDKRDFSTGDVEDPSFRRRFKWDLNKQSRNHESTYVINVVRRLNNGASFTPCDNADPIISSE